MDGGVRPFGGSFDFGSSGVGRSASGVGGAHGVRPVLSVTGTAILALNGAVLVALLVSPLRRRFRQEDQGDGITHVHLPKPPRPVRAVRGFSFFGIGLVLSFLLVAFDRPLSAGYRHVLTDLASWALVRPESATVAASHADPGLALLTATYFVCLTATVRATLPRRVSMLAHVLLFLGLATALDTLLVVVGAATGWPVVPGTVEEAGLVLALGFLVFVRLVFVTFMLPRPSLLPKTRPFRPKETSMIAVAICAGLAVAAVVIATIGEPGIKGQATQIILSLFVFSGFFMTVTLILVLARWLGPPSPPLLDTPPPLDVVVAAYNEEDILEANLVAIDRAASVYGGSVHVIVVNDGSTDNTVQVAEATMSRFAAATGEVVTRPNGGIARAYNTGLEHAKNEYIVRIDADTLVHPDAFPYIVRWLPDPAVGQVSALYLPRTDLPESWFHRGRLLECLFGFGFARLGHQVVDAVVNAPGPLSGFRRSVALEIGGFTSGMNGEDLDFTNKVGRAGYREIIDPKIIAYEDCPYSLAEFRSQRNRWSRAGIHCFARYAPFSAGLGGPRTWYTFPRLFSSRFFGPLRILVLLHAILVAIFRPEYRFTILIVGSLYLAASLPTIVVASVLMIRYGFSKKLPWLLIWYPFLLTRRFVVLEGLLSLPTRPFSLGSAWESVRSAVGRRVLAPGYAPEGEPA